jgi:hypothetical protein
MSVETFVSQQRRQRAGGRERRLAALAPSAWWIQEINSGRVKTFPPRAEHARMHRCRSGDDRHHCQRFYPGYYVRDDCKCEDCHQARLRAEEDSRDLDERRRPDGTYEEDEDKSTLAKERPAPLTPYGEALAEMKAQGGKMPETLKEPLASEDDADLRAEVEAARRAEISPAMPRSTQGDK